MINILKYKVPVLTFHEIGDRKSHLTVSKKRFEKIVLYFYSNGYKSLTISEFLKILEKKDYPALKNKVIFTFDDAFSSVEENALKILRKYHYVGNVFLITGHKEAKQYSTNKSLPNFRLLTARQLNILKRNGWEIHAHSHSHRTFNMDRKEIEDDIRHNIRLLSPYLNYNKKYLSFCYPKNIVKPPIKAVCKKYFAAGFCGGGAPFRLNQSKYTITRIEPKESEPFFLFRLMLCRISLLPMG